MCHFPPTRPEPQQRAPTVAGDGKLVHRHEEPLLKMSSFKQRLMLRLINIWPPIAGSGIRVRWGADMKSVDVEMKLRMWNRNYVGTHYGGSLYSMTDPFYMLLLMNNL